MNWRTRHTGKFLPCARVQSRDTKRRDQTNKMESAVRHTADTVGVRDWTVRDCARLCVTRNRSIRTTTGRRQQKCYRASRDVTAGRVYYARGSRMRASDPEEGGAGYARPHTTRVVCRAVGRRERERTRTFGDRRQGRRYSLSLFAQGSPCGTFCRTRANLFNIVFYFTKWKIEHSVLGWIFEV